MSAPVAVGVIGAGAFGERHVAAYSRIPGAEVVGVADRDPERARAVAERWGVPRAFADGLELLADCRPAGVSVATPGRDHLPQALAALEQGCFVLLEKPVTMSSAEAGRLLAAEAASAASVVPAHILRFADPYIALRERVRRGAVGTPLAISAQRDRPRSHERLFPGVHPALMTMVHDIDLALWIAGARAREVSATACGSSVVWAHVRADDGGLWSIRTSWVLPDEAATADRIEVYGSAGIAAVALEPVLNVFATPVERVDLELAPDAVTGALDSEVAHFCECVRAGVPSDVVRLDEASHGIAIAEAIIAATEGGGDWVAVAG